MEIGKIVENFALFAGLSVSDAMQWLPLCRWAKESVEQSLRPGVDLQKNKERLSLVAAALALRAYDGGLSGSSDLRSMSVGDVKVENAASGSAASQKIWEEMWGLCRDLLQHPQGGGWMRC